MFLLKYYVATFVLFLAAGTLVAENVETPILEGMNPEALAALPLVEQLNYPKTRYENLTEALKNVKEDYEHVKKEYEHVKEEYEHVKEEYEHVKEEYEHVKEDCEHLKEEYEHVKEDLALMTSS